MTLQQLRYFIVVAEQESYSKAAVNCRVSQPSLSYAIGELEKELNLPLFSKQGRNVHLTEYGRAFYQYVSQSIDMLDEGIHFLESKRKQKGGTITLAAISSIQIRLLPKLVAEYRAVVGDTETKFDFITGPEKQVIESVREGRAALGFCGKLKGYEGDLAYEKLGQDELVVVLPKGHSLAKRESLRMEDIANEIFVAYSSECGVRQILERIQRSSGIYLPVVAELPDNALVLNAVSMRHGISIMAKTRELSIHDVDIVPFECEENYRENFMIWSNQNWMPGNVEEFRSFVKKNIKHIL